MSRTYNAQDTIWLQIYKGQGTDSVVVIYTDPTTGEDFYARKWLKTSMIYEEVMAIVRQFKENEENAIWLIQVWSLIQF